MGSGAPPIGTRIKRAREAMRWTQQQLADAIGVDRKTVDNWENGRTQPRSSIGALEQALAVDLTGAGDGPEVYTDPDELRIWSWHDLPPEKRRQWISDLREAKRRGRNPA